MPKSSKPESPFKTLPSALKVALLGGETMLGVELKEVLERRLASSELSLYAATGEGSFDEKDGEAVYRDPLEARALRGHSAVVIAGTQEGALKAYGLAKAAKLKVVDCTGHLEGRPEARIASPLLQVAADGWLSILAHPAASASALVLTQLARHRPIVRCVVEVFVPASEHGKRGITELHQQTTSLLAFKPLQKEIFDEQLSFNMLAQYGEEAPAKLSTLEQRIERHVATLLEKQTEAARPPMPSLRLLQAPVFHGYSLSFWVEFESNVVAAEIGEALGSKRIDVRGFGEEAPTSAGAANQSGLIAGDIRVDRNNARAAWLWVVYDNLRVIADEAADLLMGVD